MFLIFVLGEPFGMTMVAGMPRRAAWYATACAWLPALIAITPRPRSSADSESSLLSAPRSLKEAVNCRFSNLRNTSAPVSADSVRLCTNGVRSTAPEMRAAAARMSVSETATRGSAESAGKSSRRQSTIFRWKS